MSALPDASTRHARTVVAGPDGLADESAPPGGTPASSDPWGGRDATGLAAALRTGELGSTELVAAALTRISADGFGAFVTVTAERALAVARDADARLVHARRDGAVDGLPALLGVPSAVKDLTPTAGIPTSYGSAAMTGTVPRVSAEIVERMTRAGLISLGKTNTPEFGAPCYTEPDIAPPARTPWDPSRSAGGSSGGAAAAVSGGQLPLAHGSDGGGSLRIPASVCGLVGFKPSRGLVSSAPSVSDLLGMSSHGCVSRTVRDTAAFLDAAAGPAPGDATWASGPRAFTAACRQDPPPLRIARCAVPVIAPDAPIDPAVLAAYEDASRLLERLGHELTDVDLGLPEPVLAGFPLVWGIGFATIDLPPGTDHLLRPLTRWLRQTAGAVDAVTVARAQQATRQAAFDLTARLHPFDAVLTPTLAQLPARVGALRNDDDPAADFAAQTRYTPWTSLWNMTGMPAVSLPLSWTGGPDPLPVGMMLAARPGADADLFALAGSLERALPWAHRWPTSLGAATSGLTGGTS